MISYTKGNLLQAEVDALVNTVNTVGIMGRGIALMFKERYPANFKKYAVACSLGEVVTGKMFITKTDELAGPKWIINFPTKKHWRSPSKIEWIKEGLDDLRSFIESNQLKSIAIPPLGSGNGGLEWRQVKALIETELADLNVDIQVYEPTEQYQNVAKKAGIEKLTPARALITEVIRKYWAAGLECSLLEVQKLAWFMGRVIDSLEKQNPLKLSFGPNKYGPYAHKLTKLLDGLDGSFIHCDKRISDAKPFDVVWPDESKFAYLDAYINTEAKEYLEVIEVASDIIEGFESPYGLELLATVDWLVFNNKADLNTDSIIEGLKNWPGGQAASQRKLRIFDSDSISLAVDRLKHFYLLKKTTSNELNF